MHKFCKEVLFSEEQIIEKVKELAAQIDRDYAGECVTLVGLLKGCVPFFAELMKHITVECEIDFMDVSSYNGETQSSGEVRILKDLSNTIQNKHVIIVEDIIDTGRTLKVVKGLLENRNAKSVKIVALLDKPEGRVVELEGDYIGFVIPKVFIYGYGLDVGEKYRNLPFIGVFNEELL